MVTPPRMSRSPEPFASLKGKLREGEGSDSPGTQILRYAQDDMRGWEGRPYMSELCSDSSRRACKNERISEPINTTSSTISIVLNVFFFCIL